VRASLVTSPTRSVTLMAGYETSVTWGVDNMDGGDGNLREQIERLEARMDELAETVESCRKIILASRVAIALGAALLAATLFGLMTFSPAALFGSIAALIGGFVLLGSNGSTSEQATAALREAEAQRAMLIGQIELRVVGGTDTLH